MTDSKGKWADSGYDEFIAVGAIVGLFLASVGTVLWQVYHYLRFNEWVSLSVVDLLKWCDIQWAYLPTDWIGMYRVLEFLPLSASLLIAAWVVFLSAKKD